MENKTELLTAALTAEQWNLIGFLVRRGAMFELENQMLYNSHKHSCGPAFVEVYQALAEQLPALPRVPEAKEEPKPADAATLKADLAAKIKNIIGKPDASEQTHGDRENE